MYASTALALTAALGTTLASPAPRQGPVQYTLQVLFSNGTTAQAAACHAGAAIEALCVYGSLSSEFTFSPIEAGTSSPGYLEFDAAANGNQVQKLTFITEGSEENNVQPAYFGGSTNPPVELGVDPATKRVGVFADGAIDEDWYLCPYENLGYTYQTVSYVKDFEKPTVAQCELIGLKLE